MKRDTRIFNCSVCSIPFWSPDLLLMCPACDAKRTVDPELKSRNELRNLRERYREQRRKALSIYGSLCECCGAQETLEFNHVRNDRGVWHSIRTVLRLILRAGARLKEIHLLCKVCNASKGGGTKCKVHDRDLG